MRILIIQPTLPHYRHSLFECLVEKGNNQYFIRGGGSINGITQFSSDYPQIRGNLINWRLSFLGHHFFYQRKLVRELLHLRPDHVLLNGPDFHFVSHFLVIFLCFATKTKFSFWTHGLPTNKIPFLRVLSCYLYRHASQILTYGEEGKNRIYLCANLEHHKIHAVGNCLNYSDYGNEDLVRIPKEKDVFHILFVGRLTVNKRCDQLLWIVSRLIKKGLKVKCTIVGEGIDMNRLRTLCGHLNLTNNVTFSGALLGERVRKLFYDADVFILPGKVGLSIVQALSFGLPVVTTSMPIHSPEFELLSDNYNSFLFDKLDDDIIDRLEAFHKSSFQIKEDFRQRCQETVRDFGYIPHSVADKIDKALSL